MGIRRYLVITFLAGLFLVGIGGGVTFVEFSSFQLGEEQVLGAEFMETNVVKERIPAGTESIYVAINGIKRNDVEIVGDPAMESDEIEIRGEYNTKALEAENDTDMDEEEHEFYVRNYYHYRDFYGLNYMDDILTSIKNKKIPNYKWEYYGKHVIRVAPENQSRLVVYN